MLQPSAADEAGEKFFVNIEGTIHPWDSNTITVSEIRKLGGWDATQQVVEVNLEDNTEQTLPDDAIITLKPGHGFTRKVKFQRG